MKSLNSHRLKFNQTGFSLLETLVALAILVLVLAVIMQVNGSGSRSSQLSYDYAQAIRIAQSKLAEMKTGLAKNTSGIELEKYHWHTERKKANYSDLGLDRHYQHDFGLYDLRATVEWTSTGKQRHIDIQTVILENE